MQPGNNDDDIDRFVNDFVEHFDKQLNDVEHEFVEHFNEQRAAYVNDLDDVARRIVNDIEHDYRAALDHDDVRVPAPRRVRYHYHEFLDRDGRHRVVVHYPDAYHWTDLGSPLPWSCADGCDVCGTAPQDGRGS